LVPVFRGLLAAACPRDAHLVVIGGGVVQDIGCFVASVLFRGLRWTLLPTTLLAQCDSCIGGKSSLNIAQYKNQIGTYYPPHAVRLAFDFLRTLNREALLSGLGEAIKLHLLAGPAEAEGVRRQAADALENPSVLHELVWASLRIKQRYIEADEFDRGVRRLLNYGHTFGHAFESATGYAIPHGIAVTLGVVAATFFSYRLGWVDAAAYQGLTAWLQAFFGGYAATLRRADPATVVAAMQRDKKNQDGQIRCILTRGPGRMESRGLAPAAVRPLLEDFLAAL